jgi:signal transduction histidine kinase
MEGQPKWADFNNLLTPIVGYAQMSWQQMQPDDPHRQYMEHILEAAQGAAAFTKQLTALNRRSMVIPQVVNLGRIIHEFLPVLRSFVGERIRLDVQIDPAAGNVRADPGQIQQVLMNLERWIRLKLFSHTGVLATRTRTRNLVRGMLCLC